MNALLKIQLFAPQFNDAENHGIIDSKTISILSFRGMQQGRIHAPNLEGKMAGFYLNPSVKGFSEALNSEIYVDKSEIIAYTNKVVDTKQKYICVSRPRRFGKTMTAEMLAAYYSREYDTAVMFDNLKIAESPKYKVHLNKYNVIFLNMQTFLSDAADIGGMISDIKGKILGEITKAYSDLIKDPSPKDLMDILLKIFLETKISFIFIIDEWDCIFREYKTDKISQNIYLDFLRNLLKDRYYVSLAYMTGILPIKKYGTHSALNMFSEFSMTSPGPLAEFIGFTREEVVDLCNRYQMDYDEMAEWYDGYSFLKIKTIYNPKSVVGALLNGYYDNYWNKTETYEALSIYFKINFKGLKDTIIQLLADEKKRVDIRGFTNDMITFGTYDDILTLLIHLGYLGYDFVTREVFIPNKEISDEFVTAIRDVGWDEIITALRASDDLLKATWSGDAQAVAKAVEQAHYETSIIKYNDENALSNVLSIAYYSARQYYTIVREMPAGKGFADLVFLPRRKHMDKPAMIIELKWDKSAAGAIRQIKDKQYSEIIQDYKENALLIAINYDKDSKHHECIIEKY